MNDRIKELRKALDLSQEKFGSGLGVTKSAVSRIELGAYKITDTMLKLICTEYSVNEEWLLHGTGEMFAETDSSIIAELAKEYRLDELDKKIIEHYLKLDSEDRKSIKKYLLSLTSMISQDEIAASVEDEIEEEIARYRQELEAEKKAQMLLASQKRETS